MDLDVLIAPPSVPLDALARDAEALTVRCAGRHLEHDALAVERPHFDPRAEQRLRQIDRHDADDVEPDPSEKTVGLGLDRDHTRGRSLCPLALGPEPGAGFGAGRDRDREPLLDPYLARPVAGGTRLRRDAPPAPAHRARPRNGEPALAERNRAAAFTFGTRREGGARCAARPAAGRAHLRQRECDGHAATQRSDPERDRDGGLDLVLVLGTRAAAAATENRREQIPQPAERAQVGKVELGARPPARRAARPTAAPRSRERPVAAQLVVPLALLGIAQHVVCFVDLLEAVRRLWLVGVAVGMVLLGEPAKRLLDLVGGGGLRDTEDLVVISLRCHLLVPRPPSLVPFPL